MTHAAMVRQRTLTRLATERRVARIVHLANLPPHDQTPHTRLELARLRAKLTRAEMAARLGVTASTIRTIERPPYPPSPHTLVVMGLWADMLEVEI